jgi:hypothetical protein
VTKQAAHFAIACFLTQQAILRQNRRTLENGRFVAMGSI